MNNLKHGIGKHITKTGIIFEGKFDADKLIEGKCTYSNGSTYEGTFDDYKPDGYGVSTYIN